MERLLLPSAGASGVIAEEAFSTRSFDDAYVPDGHSCCLLASFTIDVRIGSSSGLRTPSEQ